MCRSLERLVYRDAEIFSDPDNETESDTDIDSDEDMEISGDNAEIVATNYRNSMLVIRQATFREIPFYGPHSAYIMAEAGWMLYGSDTESKTSYVGCLECGVNTAYTAENVEDPEDCHQRLSPNCPYLANKFGNL
ncbi:hypothetical protein HDE_03673 [Halotydeus destructor]|nr:hypothetical protein HDE_03673 [Halotydeus destructor]